MTKTDGTINLFKNQPCFSGHYSSLRGYRSMKIYSSKKWMNAPNAEFQLAYKDRWVAFTPEDIHEYVRLLRVMGLNFAFTEEEDDYVFDIPLQKNPIMHSKMIINCARYLHEDTFPGIVQWFLRFSKERVVGVNLYTKLLIAHDNSIRGNVNHMFIPWYSFAMQMSNEEFKRLVLDNDANSSLNHTILHYKKPFAPGGYDHKRSGVLVELQAAFTPDAKFYTIYKKYKEICARFI